MVRIKGVHKGHTVVVDTDTSMRIYNNSGECLKYIPPVSRSEAYSSTETFEFDIDILKKVVEDYLEEEAKKLLKAEHRYSDGFRAKFIGKARSCGFEPGKVYTLRSQTGTMIHGRRGCTGSSSPFPCIFVSDVNHMSRCCPYTSIEAFLRNWVIEQEPVD